MTPTLQPGDREIRGACPLDCPDTCGWTPRWVRMVGIALVALGAGALFPAALAAGAERGPYARIALLRVNDGDTVDFEAGYIRHLEWHRRAGDTWVWYGWTIWAGERQRWFVYGTFGHSAESLDSPVSPAEDERDNVANVVPHAQFAGNAVYEYLPGLSRGTGTPRPTARLELTTFDLVPGAAGPFEAAVGEERSRLRGETLWYRMVAGGAAPRYVRLRPRPSLSAILKERNEPVLPDKLKDLVTRTTVEILNLRPTMSLGVSPAQPGTR